jgi:hypothetical protein
MTQLLQAEASAAEYERFGQHMRQAYGIAANVWTNPTAAIEYTEVDWNPAPTRRQKPKYLVWMPFSSYRACAQCFTDCDLKHTRNRILRTLKYFESSPNYRPRPVEMWRGHIQSLVRYGIAVAIECKNRGISDSSLQVLRELYTPGVFPKPDWVYSPIIQESHQQYLLLREERRLAMKILHNGPLSNGRWREFCRDRGLPTRSKWTMPDIQFLLTIVGNNVEYPNIYRKYNWTQEPSAHIKYPGDVACLT